MNRLGHTPVFRSADGTIVPGSVATVEYMKLGGIDQWVMIRGKSADNPLLVLLHGGPGMGETAFFRRYNAALEDRFTVVYWDQRGAGKSFHDDIPPESMTTRQFLADLDQLVDIVRARFGKKEVVLFGHSWGSILGVLYAAKFPAKVAAYVGSGQVGSWPDCEAACYAWVLEEAERTGRSKIVHKLQRIGPPPYPAESLWIERMCLSRVDGNMSPGSLWKLIKMVATSKESSALELVRDYRAFRWTLDHMWNEVSKLDLEAEAPVLEMPALFFLGRNDHWASPEVAMRYIDKLEAPVKKVVWFEHSGHEPFADEPAKFSAAMLEHVLPIAAPPAPARAA